MHSITRPMDHHGPTPATQRRAPEPGRLGRTAGWLQTQVGRWRSPEGAFTARLAQVRSATEARAALAEIARQLAGGAVRATFDREAAGAPGALAVPLRFAGRTIGALRLVPDRPRRWPRGLAHRLESVAALTAAVEQALGGIRPASASSQSDHETPSTSEIARDPVTGLHTRAFLDAYLVQTLALARRHREPLSLLVIAPDPIALIRHHDGPDLADAALAIAARAVTATLRGSDLVARLHGDRLAAVLPGAARLDALRVAEILRRALGEAGIASAVPVALTCSIGVASFPDDAPDAPALRDAADGALNRARGSGNQDAASPTDL